ncbi:hypothetical protein ATI61_10792 [Archangium gephyra]|uniref:Uncharacterized protein n=1 Tax=Archangium gephyra TaxID=48 RepID=A0ABX9JXY0_9BACT|nr:hypothetical protein [Archangium gephyra]REG29396.1 hypothetical protein ATI61_10792 [Archangium gephyra]
MTNGINGPPQRPKPPNTPPTRYHEELDREINTLMVEHKSAAEKIRVALADVKHRLANLSKNVSRSNPPVDVFVSNPPPQKSTNTSKQSAKDIKRDTQGPGTNTQHKTPSEEDVFEPSTSPPKKK